MLLYTFLTVFSSKKEKKIVFSQDEIKNLRQALGLTQAEFAKKFSLSRGLVAQWETGKKSLANSMSKVYNIDGKQNTEEVYNEDS